MDAQAIFDRVATHLAKQGHRAVARGGCVYLASNGDRCAAGCLLDAVDYQPEMEGMVFGEPRNLDGPPAELHWPAHLVEHKVLIQRLQEVHDLCVNWSSPVNLIRALQEASDDLGLSSAIVGRLDWSAVGSSQ